jgi:pimeloyl-ACP methyl ester carboxylesterase
MPEGVMIEEKKIETEPGLVFDALVDGAAGNPLVLLLHGFSESFHMWRPQLPTLAAAGYRAVAPSQRGYSPGARPDTADTSHYHVDKLIADAMNVVTACGYAKDRFHLVGHDWGGSIAWGIADRYPDRLASLTVLSRPHPNAFNRALQMADGEQAGRSQHHKAFLTPDAGPSLLANDAKRLRERLAKSGVPAAAIERHISVLGNAPAMEGALAWYRARGAIRGPLGTISVPVLYIWGNADDTVGRVAAEGTSEFVTGPYRFEILPGVGHFAADQAPDRVGELLLAHLAKYPV